MLVNPLPVFSCHWYAVAPDADPENVVLFPAQIALFGGFAVIVGAVQVGVSNKRKLSIAHSSLLPSE